MAQTVNREENIEEFRVFQHKWRHNMDCWHQWGWRGFPATSAIVRSWECCQVKANIANKGFFKFLADTIQEIKLWWASPVTPSPCPAGWTLCSVSSPTLRQAEIIVEWCHLSPCVWWVMSGRCSTSEYLCLISDDRWWVISSLMSDVR